MPRLLLLCEYPTLHGGERSMLATLGGGGKTGTGSEPQRFEAGKTASGEVPVPVFLPPRGGVLAAGFSVAAVAPPCGPLAEALSARGVEVLPFEPRDPAGRRLPQDRLRRQLARLIRRRQPDVLHANSLAMGRLSGPVAAELGVPSLAHLRDIIRLSARAVADLNCHTRLLAVSHATRDFHVGAGLVAGKTHVLYNGVDLQQFRPRQPTGRLHAELGLPASAMLVGTIGQIGLRKGQDVLVRAAVMLVGRLPQAHYLIVGARHSDKAESRVFEEGLRAAAGKGDKSNLCEAPGGPRPTFGRCPGKLNLSPFPARGQLAGRLHLLGTRQDVAWLLGELALLVHPARQEPLGRVLLEAAACGVPVIATDVGGTREIFPPESQAARLIPPDDPPALAAAVEQLAGDAASRARLGAAARRRAEDAFGAETAGAALIEHYRAVL